MTSLWWPNLYFCACGLEASSECELSVSPDNCIVAFGKQPPSMPACAAMNNLFHQAVLHGMSYEEHCSNQQYLLHLQLHQS